MFLSYLQNIRFNIIILLSVIIFKLPLRISPRHAKAFPKTQVAKMASLTKICDENGCVVVSLWREDSVAMAGAWLGAMSCNLTAVIRTVWPQHEADSDNIPSSVCPLCPGQPSRGH